MPAVLFLALGFAGCVDDAQADHRFLAAESVQIRFILNPDRGMVLVEAAEKDADWNRFDLRVVGTDVRWAINGPAGAGADVAAGEQVRMSTASVPIVAGDYVHFCDAAGLSPYVAPTFIDRRTGKEFAFSTPVSVRPCV